MKSIKTCLKLVIPLLLVTLIASYPAHAKDAKKYTGREAAYHVGEIATVCGVVASTKWAARSKGQPTFLNLDEPYPNQIFTIVIWGSDRASFGTPENTYAGKRICVTGKIKDYRGKPEIIVRYPSKIKIE